MHSRNAVSTSPLSPLMACLATQHACARTPFVILLLPSQTPPYPAAAFSDPTVFPSVTIVHTGPIARGSLEDSHLTRIGQKEKPKLATANRALMRLIAPAATGRRIWSPACRCTTIVRQHGPPRAMRTIRCFPLVHFSCLRRALGPRARKAEAGDSACTSSRMTHRYCILRCVCAAVLGC